MPVELDKFYTQPQIAKQCCDFLYSLYPKVKNKQFLEPSAGSGNFLPYLNNYIALDIKPENDKIIKQDFFTWVPPHNNFITIGNPPFGSRSKLAIQFFNYAAKFSDIIAFIVPVSFMKWSVQKELDNNFSLVDYFYLPEESFLVNNSPYGVRTLFQIWVKKNSEYDNKVNKRLLSSPPISHNDFKIWQYNATPEALPTVEEDWEIATYRQGYHDYNELFSRKDYEYIKEKMTAQRKQQFFFIKPLTDEARKIILSMDFNLLAERNTSTPGFGKGDFVNYYLELKTAK